MHLRRAITAVLVTGTAYAETPYKFALFPLEHLAPESYPFSGANAIGSTSIAVGSSFTETGLFHPVVWRPIPLDLGTLGGSNGEAWDIVGDDLIVGWASPPGGGAFDERAFAWMDGMMVDLGTLGGDESLATAANTLVS